VHVSRQGMVRTSELFRPHVPRDILRFCEMLKYVDETKAILRTVGLEHELAKSMVPETQPCFVCCRVFLNGQPSQACPACHMRAHAACLDDFEAQVHSHEGPRLLPVRLLVLLIVCLSVCVCVCVRVCLSF
jgi:hypothetical protein